MKINISLNLTSDQQFELFSGKAIESTCSVKMDETADKSNKLFLPEEISEIIDYWNKHRVLNLPHVKNEKRNNKYSKRKGQYETKIFDKALKKRSVQEILDLMDEYFEHIESGNHIMDGKNMGYLNVTGFLKAVTKDKLPWWHKTEEKPFDDENEKLTHGIANMFAQRFLGREKFCLKNPSTLYRNFMKIAERVERVHKRVSEKYDISIKSFVTLLLECAEKTYDKPIKIGNLHQDNFWKVYFSQYFKERYS